MNIYAYGVNIIHWKVPMEHPDKIFNRKDSYRDVTLGNIRLYDEYYKSIQRLFGIQGSSEEV